MRIALVHYSFPPVIGGVERILEEHALLFAAAGHEVTAVCGLGNAPQFREGMSASDASDTGLYALERSTWENQQTPDSLATSREEVGSHGPIRLNQIPTLAASHPKVRQAQNELSEGNTVGAFAALRESLLLELRPLFAGQDVVMIHNVCTMPFHVALTAALWQLANELSETRFVCWVHDLAAINPDYTVPDAPPWDFLRRASDHFEYVAVSDLRQRQLCELTGIPPERCRVIPNGLDPVKELGLTPHVERLCRALDLLARDLVLLQPTRLLRRKNLELSLHVAAALKAAGQSISLLVTGAPDPHNSASTAYAELLRTLQTKLGLEQECYFLGELFDVSPEDLISLYRTADALFFPSHQEGFGLPVIEGALHCLPVFCTDIEPFSRLPGTLPFSPTASPSEIAAMIIRQMQAWPANSPRKAVARNYAWSAIYRKCLAPLLTETKNRRHP